MNIFLLSMRNISYRKLSSLLCVILLALGVGLITLIVQIQHHFKEKIDHNLNHIDMVVGAKGSPLQLILSAVYHIDAPTGNISLQEAEKLKKNRFVHRAIPLSYGDNYKGYRIVGTNHQYSEIFEAKLYKGLLWEKVFEVTVGASVAKKLQLKLGDTFNGGHGLIEGGEIHEDQLYTVVGIFQYSNSVLDNLILTSTQSVWDIHSHSDEHSLHHEHEGHDHYHDHQHEDEKQITALLIEFKNPMALMQLPRFVNEKTNMQAAIPTYEMHRLLKVFGIGITTLNTLALIIVLVSGLSIFISLYNSLKDRKFELALMRTYGANKTKLVWLVLQEALIISILGYLLGLLCSRVAFWIFSSEFNITYSHGIPFSFSFLKEELWLFCSTLLIAILAAIIPTVNIYRLNISKTLSNA